MFPSEILHKRIQKKIKYKKMNMNMNMWIISLFSVFFAVACFTAFDVEDGVRRSVSVFVSVDEVVRDECLEDPCGPGQTCRDPNTSPTSLGDVICRCELHLYDCVVKNSIIEFGKLVHGSSVEGIQQLYSFALSFTTVDECSFDPCNPSQLCVDAGTAGNSRGDYTCTCAVDDYYCHAESIYIDCYDNLSIVAEKFKNWLLSALYFAVLHGSDLVWICFTQIHGCAPRLTNIFCGYVLFSTAFMWFWEKQVARVPGHGGNNRFRATSFVLLFARTVRQSLCQIFNLICWLAAVFCRRFRGRLLL